MAKIGMKVLSSQRIRNDGPLKGVGIGLAALAGMLVVGTLYEPNVLFLYGLLIPIWLAVHFGGRSAGFVVVCFATVVATISVLIAGWNVGPWYTTAFRAFIGLGGMLILFSHLEGKLRRTNLDASFDALTGILNRRAGEQMARHFIDRSRNQRRDLALLVIDCDHFKQINDEFGHEAGDEALKILASCLETASGHGDIIYRQGGDEFVAILQGGEVFTVNRYIGWVRSLVADRSTNKPYRISVTAG